METDSRNGNRGRAARRFLLCAIEFSLPGSIGLAQTPQKKIPPRYEP